jgi:hypothetical protein
MLTRGDIHEAKATIEEPRKLKHLSFDVKQLSVSFLDLLARRLPQLEELTLSVSEFVGTEQV